MESVRCLNELPDRLIETISEYLDILDLTEVFKIGNRLLSLKLGTAFAYYPYSDIGRCGLSVCAHHWLLPQLGDLKQVSISNFSSAKSKKLIIRNLPKTVTSIDLCGRGSLEVWADDNKRKLVPTNISERFPSLNSLSLKGCLADFAEEGWFDRLLSVWFPPTLTHLCLEHTWTSCLDTIEFPPSLEYLEITKEYMPNFSWVFSLPNLHTLKLDFVTDCIYEEGEELGECDQRQHHALTTLHLLVYKDREDDDFERCNRFRDFLSTLKKTLKTLFRAFPSLQEISTGTLAEVWDDDLTNSAPSNLRILSCLISSGVTYPSSLEELRWGYPPDLWIRSEDCVKLDSADVARLPPSLLVLHSEWLSLGTDVDGSLFPRNLTSLTAAKGIQCEQIQSLPPGLTRLGTIILNISHLEFFEELNSTLPLLNYVSTESHDFCKIPTSASSIYGSGWTCLTHATFSEDIESLEQLVVEHSKHETGPSLWTAVFNVIDEFCPSYRIDDRNATSEEQILGLPRRSLEWFRMRGLCSHPRRLGHISSRACFAGIRLSALDTLSFIQWAHPHLDKSVWKQEKRRTLPKLSHDSKVPVLEFLYSNGYNMKNEDDRILTEAIKGGQIKAVEWLLNHGYPFRICSILAKEPSTRKKPGPESDKVAQVVQLLRNKKVSFERSGEFTSWEVFNLLISGKADPTLTGFVIWLEWLVGLGLQFITRASQLTTVLLIDDSSRLTPVQVENWLAGMKWLNSKGAPMDSNTFSKLQALVSSTPNNTELSAFLLEQTQWK